MSVLIFEGVGGRERVLSVREQRASERATERERDRQTDIQTDRERERKRERRERRERERARERERERERECERERVARQGTSLREASLSRLYKNVLTCKRETRDEEAKRGQRKTVCVPTCE